MAREIVYTDDLSGEHGAEPVQFAWDGVTWEIDLAEANRKKLADFLEPYLEKAHPANVAQAEPQRRTRAARETGGKRTLTEEDYGFPRRGRTSAEERNYVKNNLDTVNARLRAAGVREIDPSDEKLAERYGL